MADPLVDPCSFEGVHTEGLNYCPNEDVVGGTAVDFFYAPKDFFETLTKPVVTGETSYTQRIKLAANAITFKTGKGWKKATMMIDENELKNTFVGNKGNKKPKVDFDAFLPNFIARNVGFFDAHRNTPMIWAVPDSTGVKWIVGNLDAPAYFDKSDGTSGKTYDNNSGFAMTVTANTKLLVYEGEIVELAD